MNRLRMARATARAALLGAFLLGAGCAGPPHDVGHPDLLGSTRALPTLTSADVTVAFYAVPGPDDRPAIAMSERGSAYAKSFLVAPLVAEAPTAQEICLALAGLDAVAPRAAPPIGTTPECGLLPAWLHPTPSAAGPGACHGARGARADPPTEPHRLARRAQRRPGSD